MVDLTNWSNDLKLNTEKKLSASFETASRFRTMYLDKETREAKITEELRLAHVEIDNQHEALSESLGKAAQLEIDFNKEKDSKSANAALVATIRQRHAETEAERVALYTEKSTLTERLDIAESKITELSEIAAGATAATERAATTDMENREIKARAFDNYEKIAGLEQKVAEKEKENKDILELVEELMKREEERKGID